MTTETPAGTPASTAPAVPPPSAPATPPPAPNTLAEFRAQRSAALEPPAETPPPAPQPPPIATDLDAPMVDEGDDDPPPQAAQPETPQGPQQDPRTWRWKDPETGVVLDMRRRESKRIKRLLEERADYARQVATLRQPTPQEPPAQAQPQQRPQAFRPDPNDPEPTLEQFADQSDPYQAHGIALARWHARQEFQQQMASHTRVERARQAQAQISRAQQAYDADLPSARTRYPDFDDAHAEVLSELGRVPMPVRAPLVHRLLTSSLRHDLTHYLGSHPDDLAAVVSARSPYEQGLVLGAIETRVRALVNQRSAPAHPSPTLPAVPAAPMVPVAGGASPVAIPDASKINSLAQFRALKPKFGMRG